MVNELIEAIEAQIKGKENKPEWCVGHQIIDICKETPEYAEIVLKDLDNKEMSVSACEKKIKDAAKKNGGFCGPEQADKIIRDFYGLGAADAKPAKQSAPVLDLASFLR